MDLREQIKKGGGLVNRQDIARAWGVSRQRAYELAKVETFPAPVCTVRILGAMYLRSEVDAWRDHHTTTPELAKRDRAIRKARELAAQPV